MGNDSFKTFLRFFSELPSARFDAEAKVWRVPKADFERVVESVSDPEVTALVADGGGR